MKVLEYIVYGVTAIGVLVFVGAVIQGYRMNKAFKKEIEAIDREFYEFILIEIANLRNKGEENLTPLEANELKTFIKLATDFINKHSWTNPPLK